MIKLLLVAAAHDELGTRSGPDRRVLAGFPVPWCFGLPHKPTRLVLEPVERARQDSTSLVPDDLLVVLEADTQQAIEDFPGEFRGVPHVADLQARHEGKSFGPVRPRVARDLGFRVAGGSMLQV